MKISFPGLLKEQMPSGNIRYRVRVEGNPHRRIRLFIDPGHKEFSDHYRAARAGIAIDPEKSPVENSVRGSISWLTHKYIRDIENRVKSGLSSPITLKRKKLLLAKLRDECGEFSIDIPAGEIIRIRDTLSDTPAWADSLVVTIRSMYKWASERGICDINPAIGISRIDRGKGGAVPWTITDITKYKSHHQAGSMAHLCLTLLMFTACRIGDAVTMGRDNEFMRNGIRGLAWQPQKKNSAFVEIPMAGPLFKATRNISVIGSSYLVTDYGHPYKSPDALGTRFRKWCRQAGLEGRSSHGIRKAAGHLLAREGCSQYQIMAIHGHTEAATSEIYTKGVDRWQLASTAMEKLGNLEW